MKHRLAYDLILIDVWITLLMIEIHPVICQEEKENKTSVTVPNVCDMSLASIVENEAKNVKCNCFDVLVDCNDLELTDLPKLISFPKSVHSAKFRSNKIGDIKEDTFYNGREIHSLDLSYNRINFISIKAFNAFPSLLHLDLSYNRLWNIPEGVTKGLTKLLSLDLSHNDLGSIFPELFQHLTQLQILSLASNPLQELEPKHFAHLENVQVLNLDSILLKVIPDHLFLFTKKLTTLSLANNMLTEVPTDAFKVLNHLKYLKLNGNPIVTIPSQAFSGLSRMLMLYMDMMPELKKIEKYAFGDLIHLQELHCSYNHLLEEIDERAFMKKENREKIAVSQVFFRQNKLKSIPEKLLNWNEDMELFLRENPWDCNCKIGWLLHLKLKNNFQDHLKCTTPDHYKDIPLSNMAEEDLTCGRHMSEILLITSLVIIALLLIVLVAFIFMYWRRSHDGYVKPYSKVSNVSHINDIEYRGDDEIYCRTFSKK